MSGNLKSASLTEGPWATPYSYSFLKRQPHCIWSCHSHVQNLSFSASRRPNRAIYCLLLNILKCCFRKGGRRRSMRTAIPPRYVGNVRTRAKFYFTFLCVRVCSADLYFSITEAFKVTTGILWEHPLWYKLKHVARNKRSLQMKCSIFWIKLKEFFSCV